MLIYWIKLLLNLPNILTEHTLEALRSITRARSHLNGVQNLTSERGEDELVSRFWKKKGMRVLLCERANGKKSEGSDLNPSAVQCTGWAPNRSQATATAQAPSGLHTLLSHAVSSEQTEQATRPSSSFPIGKFPGSFLLSALAPNQRQERLTQTTAPCASFTWLKRKGIEELRESRKTGRYCCTPINN